MYFHNYEAISQIYDSDFSLLYLAVGLIRWSPSSWSWCMSGSLPPNMTTIPEMIIWWNLAYFLLSRSHHEWWSAARAAHCINLLHSSRSCVSLVIRSMLSVIHFMISCRYFLLNDVPMFPVYYPCIQTTMSSMLFCRTSLVLTMECPIMT